MLRLVCLLVLTASRDEVERAKSGKSVLFGGRERQTALESCVDGVHEMLAHLVEEPGVRDAAGAQEALDGVEITCDLLGHHAGLPITAWTARANWFQSSCCFASARRPVRVS